MAISQRILQELQDQCDHGVATEGCIPVRRDDLKALLDEVGLLRKAVVGRSPPLDPKVEERIKYIEQWIKKNERDLAMLNTMIAGMSSKIGQLECGAGSTIAHMAGAGS